VARKALAMGPVNVGENRCYLIFFPASPDMSPPLTPAGFVFSSRDSAAMRTFPYSSATCNRRSSRNDGLAILPPDCYLFLRKRNELAPLTTAKALKDIGK
jgi:hypothetical protein